MSYQWTRYDRQTGELLLVIEEGEPCLCEGEYLPHPTYLVNCRHYTPDRFSHIVPTEDIN